VRKRVQRTEDERAKTREKEKLNARARVGEEKDDFKNFFKMHDTKHRAYAHIAKNF